MTDFTSHPCSACDYRDGVLVRRCEQCRRAMAEINHPPAAGDRLHIPTLQAAARAVCGRCRVEAPVKDFLDNGIRAAFHWVARDYFIRCDAEAIHRLIEKEQEAQHGPR